ncbi:MAG TPA: hypothetical protein VFX33_11270, partial [Actinomycetales bacterium]|nr:hypothetical protein [Actinomycetales bacterium]
MLLADVAAAVQDVAATSSRSAKARRLAETLRAARSDDLPVVVAYLSGELRQRRTGIGWGTLADRPPPATEPTLTVHDADETFARAERASGTGADGVRRSLVHSLFSRATAAEQQLLAALLAGELRQGAARGVLAEAIAVASGADPAAVRRAFTLSGSLPDVAVAALSAPDADTANKHLADFGLTVGRALGPMLAQSAPSVAEAVERTGPAAVEWKLDGIRVQIHRDGDEVRV